MKGDSEAGGLSVDETTSINNIDIITAMALVKSTNDEYLPVRFSNLFDYEKVIGERLEVAKCAPVEAVINLEGYQDSIIPSSKEHRLLEPLVNE